MADRSTVTQLVQFGVEATPGTRVNATKLLQAASIDAGIKIEVDAFRPTGYKFPTIAAPNREWTEAKVGGKMTYTEIVYFLSSLITTVTPVQQGGGLGYKWSFAPNTSSQDNPKTFTVQVGDQSSANGVRAHEFSYGIVNSLGMKWDRKSTDITGSMFGQLITDNVYMDTSATYTLTAAASPPTAGTYTLTVAAVTTAAIAYNATTAAVQAALEAISTVGTGNVVVTATVAAGAGDLSVANNVYTVKFVRGKGQQAVTMTGTFTGLTPVSSIALASTVTGAAPTAVELVPVLAKQLDVYTAATQAGLGGAARLTRCTLVDWSLNDRYSPIWVLDSSKGSYAGHIEAVPKGQIKFSVEADSGGMSYLTNLRAGSSVFLRVKALGDVIDANATYTVQGDFALKLTNVSEFKDMDGLYGVEWTGDIVHDATWGKAFQIDVINKLSTL